MTFVHWLVVLSAIVGFAGAFAYIRDTLAGRSKPNRVSWFMWALAPLIGTAAALSAQADTWATLRIFLAGFFPLLVFIASFIRRKGYWKLTSFDLICGLFSLAAIIAWVALGSTSSAILLAIVGDAFACIPTLRKAWKHPETETGLNYVLAAISTLLIFPSIPKWDIQNSAFQIYLLVADVLLFSAVYHKRFSLFIKNKLMPI